MSDLERRIQTLAGKYFVTKCVFKHDAYRNVVVDYSAPGADPIKITGSCIRNMAVFSTHEKITIPECINYFESITFDTIPKHDVDEHVHKIAWMSITFYNYIEVVPGGTEKATCFDYPKNKDLMTNASMLYDITIHTIDE
jgi:hypothetical protein